MFATTAGGKPQGEGCCCGGKNTKSRPFCSRLGFTEGRTNPQYPNAGGEDYIFLPEYTNRETAARIFARQFNVLLEKTG